jgi:hypothetical protein
MPTDLILLAAIGAIGIGLGCLAVGWDRRRHLNRQHHALRSFYERQ